MIKRMLYPFLMMLLPHLLFSQNRYKTDSLLTVLKQSTDTDKVIVLNQLSRAYQNINMQSAILYAEEALKTGKWLHYKKGISNALNNLGNIQERRGNFDQALDYFKQAINSIKETADVKAMAGSYHNIANVYKDKGNYKEATKYYLKALAINDSTGNIEWKSLNLNALGLIYIDEGNYDKALQYIRKSAHINNKMRNEPYAVSINSIGIIYKKRLQLDSALYYFNKSLNIYKKLRIKEGVGICLNNIGVIYSLKDEKQKALSHFRKALAIYKEYKNNKRISLTACNIGTLLSKLGQYQDAEKSLIEAKDIAEAIKDGELIKNAYKELADHYRRLNEFEPAYKYQVLYSLLQDSLNKQKNFQVVANLEAEYERQKNEIKIQKLAREKTVQQLEIEKKNAQINQQKILAYSLAGVILLISGLVLLVFRSNKQKQKVAQLLTLQKAELQEVHNNITDSIKYASRIQEAILPDQEHLNELFRDSFIFYKPRDIVSGDFYWFWTDEKHGVLAVADCTGHGVPGAFMSMIGQDLLNQIVKDGKIYNPSQILRIMDHKVSAHLNKKGARIEYNDGMDIGILAFNKETQTAYFSGAYRPMLQVRGQYIIEHPANKFSIGGVDKSSCKLFYNSNVEFKKGDTLYIFSDGFADQFGGERGKKFMNKQFSDLLLSIHPKPMHEQREIIEKTFNQWKGELEQVDDVLIVGVLV